MRLHSLMLTGMLGMMSLLGQEAPAPQKLEAGLQAAIIPVKTLTGDSFNRLVKMLSVFGVRYAGDENMRTIIVYAQPDTVAQMRKVVEQLDRPGSEAAIGRNIEVNLAFLRCSTTSQGESGPLPADLESAARQLKAATQYKYIQVMDVVPLRVQEGKDTQQELQLPGALPDIPGAIPQATIQLRAEAVTRRNGGRFVKFHHLNVLVRMPYSTTLKDKPGVSPSFQWKDTSLRTAGDFREGQKAIVGKLSGIEEGVALFVVISLKVLDDGPATP